MIKQSVAWWCFVRDGMTPLQFVKSASEIGYRGVDLAKEEYWQMILDHGLELASIDGHKSIIDGMNRKENHDRIVAELEEKIEKSVKWKIRNLICFSGSRAGLDDEIGIENTAICLQRLAKSAEDAGVNLVLELLNSKVDHPDYQADHTEWGVKVVERVNSPRVKLLYDIYHMQIMEGDLIRTIEKFHAWFAHYHTAGNPGRGNLDASQEIQYPAVVAAIRRTGYDGFLCQEFIPRGDPVKALQEAFAVCS